MISKGIFLSVLFFSMNVFGNQCDFFLSNQAKYSPQRFLQTQVTRAIQLIDANIETTDDLFGKVVDINAYRTDLLVYLYKEKVIAATELNALLADKLIFSKVLMHYLKSKYPTYHPQGIGLKGFLLKFKLLNEDGTVTEDQQKISDAIDFFFPKGFVLKPLLTVNSNGSGFITNKQKFIEALLNSVDYFNPTDIKKISEISNGYIGDNNIGSGERFFLQGMIGDTILDPNKKNLVNEYRVHTFDQHVIEGATEGRWYIEGRPGDIDKVNDYIRDFIKALPKTFWNKQAYSFDVYVTEDGLMNIVEMNTNFGKKSSWSGFLVNPWVIGAYVRFFEEQFNWDFKGFSGYMFRNDLANFKKYLKSELYYSSLDFNKNVDLDKINTDVNKLYIESTRYIAMVSKKNKEYVSTLEFINHFISKYEKVKTTEKSSWTKFFTWADDLSAF